MSTLFDFRGWFDSGVRDAAERITVPQKDRAIADALARYAKVRPVSAAQDYPGDGTTFDFSLPSGWVDGLSTVQVLEYPAGERIPVLLDRDEYQLYRSPTGVKIRLLQVTPPVGKTLRVTYSRPHVVDQSGSTVGASDEQAVANLAAAIGLRELAAHYANTQDPTIAADVVNYRSKSEEYLRIAKDLERTYSEHLGLGKDSEARAGSAFVDVDQGTLHGLDKLTHPNARR